MHLILPSTYARAVYSVLQDRKWGIVYKEIVRKVPLLIIIYSFSRLLKIIVEGELWPDFKLSGFIKSLSLRM